MYISRAVKSIRDDPMAGESVDLALATAADADPDAVVNAAEAAGGTVQRRLQFDDLVVSVSQDSVADICAIDGLDAVETTDAIAITTAAATDEDVDIDS
jgi:hypothetical protein